MSVAARLLGAIVPALLAPLTLGCSAASDAPRERLGADHSANTGSSGYCRTTTCGPPERYPTADGLCEPAGWSDSQVCIDRKASNAPLWWRTACVGYDLNRGSSSRVSFDAFSSAARAAFEAWSSATCPVRGPTSRVSIDARDLGPIDCARATYDRGGGPNQNVIVFHDDAWPYEERDRLATGLPKSPTIALTTVTFDPGTGEIYDADIELNSAGYPLVPLVSGADANATSADTFDLGAVLTHEVGHFLGLAHSPVRDAVMFASGDAEADGARKRALTLEDVRGICAIYPPGGVRGVSTLVDARGRTAAGACDPTPRHGFSSTCGG